MTRVVENAGRALAEKAPYIQTITIGGTGAQVLVEGIDYTTGSSLLNSSTLVDNLTNAAKQALGGQPDVWHIHNHSLGKHPSLCATVNRLAAEGTGILLHIHDFAEDGRPTNHQLLQKGEEGIDKLYPIAPHIHYAALNHRDFQFLKNIGVPNTNLHSLPNPVYSPELPKSKPDLGIVADHLFLYPVRAVRRKNLGELALWASIAPKGHFFASSLGPTNPQFLPIYRQWQTLASELNIPLELGINDRLGVSFPQLVAAADTLITTSLAEGFGLAFLEPWAMQKPLVGRNLHEITGDFVQNGIHLEHLYNRLEVPASWIDQNALGKKLTAALDAYFKQYGKNLPEGATETALDSILIEGKLDFGRLDEHDQLQIIRKASKSPEALPKLPKSPAIIEKQANHVTENYNLPIYAKRLESIYQTIANSKQDTVSFLDPEKMLKQFLDPARFSFLRN